MPSTMTDPHLDLFRSMYGDAQSPARPHRCLDFRMDVRPEEFPEYCRAIGQYNEFDPEKVIDALTPVLPHVSDIRIGRAYSPVVYLTLKYFGDGYSGVENNRRVATEIEEAALAAGAEEVGVEDGASPPSAQPQDVMVYRMRLWWD